LAHDRRRAREARLEARRVELAHAAARRERAARRRALRARLTPTPRHRPRRYGALSALQRLQVLLAFVLVQALVWVLAPQWQVRLVSAVLTAAVLAVLVRTRRRTPR